MIFRIKLKYLFLSIPLNIIALIYYPLLQSGYPLLKFLTSEIGRFDDFWNYRISSFSILFPTNGNFFLYPISIPLYQFFGNLEYRTSLVFFIILTIVSIFLLLFLITKNIYVTFLLMLQYPLYFTVFRGNNDLIIFSLLLLTYFLILTKKIKSAILVSVLIQFIEPYPFILFLFLKNWKLILKIFIILSFIFMVYFTVLYGMDSFVEYVIGLFAFSGNYSTDLYPGSSLHSISLSGSLQTLSYFVTGFWPTSSSIFFNNLNIFIFIIGIALCLIFCSRNNVSVLDKLLFITISWGIFRSVSFDYAQIHFLLPLAILLNLNSNESNTISLKKNKFTKSLYFIIFILILIVIQPKPYLWFFSTENQIGSTLGSLLNPIILIVILMLLFFKKFFIKYFQNIL